MLLSGDYRQEEKTFAMIEQVGGRAGRRQKGKVIVQTFNPQHYAIRFAAKHDYAGFYRQEIAFRKATGKPPFSRIYRLVFTHAQAERAQQACRAAEETLRAALRPYAQEILLFAAKPAPVARLDGKTRYHILVKARVGKALGEIRDRIYDAWEQAHAMRGLTIGIEIDPYEIH